VPATAVYEPNYEADPTKSTRYRIWVQDEPAFAIAGLWRSWPDGLHSFTMLTLNADNHLLMRRMHAPGKGETQCGGRAQGGAGQLADDAAILRSLAAS
jgi:hypothetical protein